VDVHTAIGDCLESVFDLVESPIRGKDGNVTIVGCIYSSTHCALLSEGREGLGRGVMGYFKNGSKIG
jgi:hypothetical protein